MARAEVLATRHPAALEVLRFYALIAGLQRGVSRSACDRKGLVAFREPLVRLVAAHGPEALARVGKRLDDPSLVAAIEGYWSKESPASLEDFFARVLLEPYAAALETQQTPSDSAPTTCPTCDHAPQVGVLRPEGDGSALSWVCSLCTREWRFPGRRCVSCGEAREDRLSYFNSEEQLPYVRILACDTCKTYVHAIDIVQQLEAEPLVDELAALPLDVWARESGYHKLQVNLAGM